MFTGIIQQTGTIEAIDRLSAGARVVIRIDGDDDFARGESVAVNGVCLTVMPQPEGALATDVSSETLRRTTLGSLKAGTRVNIERALAVGDRLGGHIVQGHVDTVGALLSIDKEGEFAMYRWSFPSDQAALVVSKGSIAVDGVSLTIVDPDGTSFGAALIPETLRRTNLGASRAGDPVNLEFDMIAKYVRNLTAPYLPRTSA
jgi:riboflavin synthase